MGTSSATLVALATQQAQTLCGFDVEVNGIAPALYLFMNRHRNAIRQIGSDDSRAQMKEDPPDFYTPATTA
ncbi:hypothetical protein ACTXT7_005220 [Hymenolepis weldensis]